MAQPKSGRGRQQSQAWHVRGFGLTDVGKVRANNEDSFSIDAEGGLFTVSDGMGGLQAGEVASALVTHDLPELVRGMRTPGHPRDGLEILSKAIRTVGERVAALCGDSRARGAGATVVACLVEGRTAFVAHTGDSRAYLLRGGAMECLTEDHSIVAMMQRLGQLTKEQAENHFARHVISRYVGMEADPGPDVRAVELHEGDRLLLCSDGLTTMLPDERIAELLGKSDGEAACRSLVDEANLAGGKDNITALVVTFDPA